MPITSHSNPKIKLARALRSAIQSRKARQESGLFLVEGIRPAGEAAESGSQIAYVLYCPALLHSEYALNLVLDLEQRGVDCFTTSREIFESLTEKDNPQGILAIVHQFTKQLSDLNPENFPWGVALVDPQDPGNLGTIIRTIDAVGASGLLLLSSSSDQTGLVDIYHPNAVRASMGTMFWHPVISAAFAEFSQWVESNAYHVYGTSAHASSDFRQMETYFSPSILLMGSERAGLADEQTIICERMLSLPMKGRATSLNLAVAAGVLLYDMQAKLKS